jgi:hypothetical protein
MQTYNYKRIIDLLREMQTYHEQLQSFGHGSIEQLIYLTEERLKQDNTEENFAPYYPSMWVVPQEVSKDTGATVYTFDILIMDIQNAKNWDNYLDTMSDTLDILKDIVAMLKYSSERCYCPFDVEVPVKMSPFQESFDDYVNGWTGSIRLIVPDPIDNCITPYATFPPCPEN